MAESSDLYIHHCLGPPLGGAVRDGGEELRSQFHVRHGERGVFGKHGAIAGEYGWERTVPSLLFVAGRYVPYIAISPEVRVAYAICRSPFS